MTQAEKRAAEMLRIAARFIREVESYSEIYYDGTLCDGVCVADDCETAAAMLEPEEGKKR